MSVPTTSDHRIPFWATPRGVIACVAAYCLLFAFLNGILASSINIDDGPENYFAQGLALSYVPRNPPLFDWILFFLQQITGSGRAGLVILRYGLLFTCAGLIYLIARRVIRDPRLQALTVFALPLFWLIGYHSHRIITHSNVMIVAIAGSFLAIIELRRSPTIARYALLGLWIVIGVLGKFGFIAYAAVTFSGMVAIREFRPIVLSRKMLITVAVAGIPLAAYFFATFFSEVQFVTAIYKIIGPQEKTTTLKNLAAFAGGVGGYVLPFALIYALAFGSVKRHFDSSHQDCAALQLIAFIAIAGTLISLFVALGGSPNIRDRYFHLWYLLLPALAFGVIDGTALERWRLNLFLRIAGGLTLLIAGVFLAQRLAPSPQLCHRCVPSAPYAALGAAISARHGPSPTIVTDDIGEAGQIRTGMPQARLIATPDTTIRTIPRPEGPCLTVWQIFDADTSASDDLMDIARSASVDLGNPEIIAVDWWAPLLPGGRVSHWAIVKLPPDASVCR